MKITDRYNDSYPSDADLIGARMVSIGEGHYIDAIEEGLQIQIRKYRFQKILDIATIIAGVSILVSLAVSLYSLAH